MKKQYHILNGDSLKEQFPSEIKGELIVARECLVDGDVQGNNLEQFFLTRAKFISTSYSYYTEQDYFEKTVPEFEKIMAIQKDSEINLWFEDDLFCQVNFWFVISLLHSVHSNNIFLVRPKEHSAYGFGGLNKDELILCYKNRQLITQTGKISALWNAYQLNNTEKMISISREIENTYPFVLPAVQAHVDRIPTNGSPGRPIHTIISIMKDLKTKEFAPVFKEFCKRESIYGFGDLQVKRLFDEIISNQKIIGNLTNNAK
ncbi:MAG: DUF1835 domain-containing protein [Chloroflexia bacterium]|nr:DUF1835 domain-containing protein [Chloroflexia bacterium]